MRQRLGIASALVHRPQVLFLDEPTAALTENESRRLFDRMRALKARGVAIIFVSHRLGEVFAISDRIVVMRDGRIRGETDEYTPILNRLKNALRRAILGIDPRRRVSERMQRISAL